MRFTTRIDSRLFMRRVWFIFFLVSGFCSLLYQVVWLRLAMARFGVTTALVSIVLSVFMGGLALGSWGGGALMRRLAHRPAAVGLRIYAAIELITAASALLVPVLLNHGRTLLATRAEASWGSAAYYAGSAVCVLVALLPFCTSMGATFPVALGVLGRARDASRGFSYLYVANVMGAALGTVVTGFVLIEILGFSGTLRVAAVLNALLGAAAWALSLRSEARAEAGAATTDTGGDAPREEAPAAAGPLLTALFLTGLVSMGMEVVWVRQLTPYLGNVVYSFSSIVAIYLVATFAGSALYRRWTRARASACVAPWAWVVVALASLLPLAAGDPRLGAEGAFRSGLLRALLGLAPFCGALGVLTPMLMDRWSRGEPRRAGFGYAVNIVGCILGPLVGGFVLLPVLGERASLVVLAVPLFLIALLPAAGGTVAAPRRAAIPVLLAGGAASALLFASTRSYESLYKHAVVRRDATATVTAAGRGMQRQLLVNGKGMTVLTPLTKMMAHLPLAFLEHAPRRAIVICFGMGTSHRSVLSWRIESTAVELVPSVPELFGYFHDDAETVLRSPRSHVVIDDGRRYLERAEGLADVILVDPPPPVEAAGSSLLYTREFYEAARRRLAPDGILQQWIPEGEPLVISAFLKAVRAVFPHVRTFESIEGWGLHILASGRPIPHVTGATLAARLPAAAARDLLEWGPQPTASEQFAAVLARERVPDDLIARAPDAPALVDDHPLNEYFLLRRYLRVPAAREARGPEGH